MLKGYLSRVVYHRVYLVYEDDRGVEFEREFGAASLAAEGPVYL